MIKRNVPTRWHKLDNTAHLFPVVTNRRYTNVFRMTAVLHEEIDPLLLKKALNEILPFFAAFNVRMRHGLFWSYLETNRANAQVWQEEESPCRYIDPVETNRFLFRVLYYKKRIHLETFHVLTDGTGAMRFLKAICYRYLQLAHADSFTPEQRSTFFGIENAGDVQDGYIENYVRAKGKAFRDPSAFHLKGERRLAGELGVVTALMPLPALKAECMRYDATIGEYLTACIAFCIYEEFTHGHGTQKPISVFVPVNLRPIFGTDTSLNFFSKLSIILPLHTKGFTFQDVIALVKQQFDEKLTREEFEQRLAYTASSEMNVFTRLIPLPLKNGILRIVYENSNNGSSIVLSNLGPVQIEELFRPYFEGFRFLLATTPKEPLKTTACSYNGILALNFSSELESHRLERRIIRHLSAAGIPITLETGGVSDEAL